MKLKITQKQLDTIILNEQKNRLNILTETTKEVVLSIAMLAGIKLSGQNEFVAKNALKDAKIMSEVKDTLEDDVKINDLVDSMVDKGMKDPKNMLFKNADKIISNFNKNASGENIKQKLDFLSLKNLKNKD
jgi:hypothetical protein